MGIVKHKGRMTGIQKSFLHLKPVVTGLMKTIKNARFSVQNSKINLNEIEQIEMVTWLIFLIYRSVF
jgi:hypothetical protein